MSLGNLTLKLSPEGKRPSYLATYGARYRTMDASDPAKLNFEYTDMHLARLADLIAREFPRDAEAI